VRELRVQQGLSQTELARHAEMTQPAVARYRRCPSSNAWPVRWGPSSTVQLAPSSSVA
jgi:hypothetical protein